MKHLFASLFAVVCFATYAQFPSLPYNPDENGDGLIGVSDLQGLLANYGNEFASAIVSEDGESANVYMGQMAYPLCTQSCNNLPGIWSIPSLEDLGLVWGEVYNTQAISHTWLTPATNSAVNSTYLLQYFYSGTGSSESNHLIDQTNHPQKEYRCYCAAKQLPRVEYDYCFGTSNLSNQTSALTASLNDLKACVNDKLSVGWHLLGTTQPQSFDTEVQGLWRWAE